MACVSCKDNIINKTPSIIGEPKCGSDCPPETTCDGGYIASTCVYYSGNNLACTGINYGLDLTEAIKKLNDKLCEIKCEKLTWINLEIQAPYTTPFINPITLEQYQIPQYAIDPCNGKIYLRGVFYLPEAEDPTGISPFLIDDINACPQYKRAFLGTAYPTTAFNGILSGLEIDTNGVANIGLYSGTGFDYDVVVTLDGLSFETN
jgi:hypothetical protein